MTNKLLLEDGELGILISLVEKNLKDILVNEEYLKFRVPYINIDKHIELNTSLLYKLN